MFVVNPNDAESIREKITFLVGLEITVHAATFSKYSWFWCFFLCISNALFNHKSYVVNGLD